MSAVLWVFERTLSAGDDRFHGDGGHTFHMQICPSKKTKSKTCFTNTYKSLLLMFRWHLITKQISLGYSHSKEFIPNDMGIVALLMSHCRALLVVG